MTEPVRSCDSISAFTVSTCTIARLTPGKLCFHIKLCYWSILCYVLNVKRDSGIIVLASLSDRPSVLLKVPTAVRPFT